MIFGILFQIVFVVLVILGIRRLRAGSSQGGIRGESVRRFFQYLLLYGLLILIAIGFSGLFARVFESSNVLVTDQTALARNVSFVIVGVPLFVGLAMWARHQYHADKHEADSFSWALYFTVGTLTLLIGASMGLLQLISWTTGQSDYQSQQLAQFIVWGGLWAPHWWISRHFTPTHSLRAYNLAGSLYGLVFLSVGLTQLLSSALERLFNLGGDDLFLSRGSSIFDGIGAFAIGLAIWALYWISSTAKSLRDVFWLAYVMLIGVGGGLVMAVTALSISLYNLLVWFFGTPGSAVASVHFRDIPTAIAAAIVGGFIWIYHRAVLHEGVTSKRTEVRRIYEYLMSAIGLIASAIGFAIVLISLIDVIIESSRITGGGSRNTLLAAVTLLVVGGPIWWGFWSQIQKIVGQNPKAEHASPSRRIYLFLLFGVGGLTAVITLVVGVFLLLDDVFKGNFGEETIQRIRIPIGLILSTAGVAGYHWLVYRAEREHYADITPRRKQVLLVGDHDEAMLREISERCTAKVQAWSLAGDIAPDWNVDEIVQAISSSQDSSVLVMKRSGVIEVIGLKK